MKKNRSLAEEFLNINNKRKLPNMFTKSQLSLSNLNSFYKSNLANNLDFDLIDLERSVEKVLNSPTLLNKKLQKLILNEPNRKNQ